MTTLAPLQQIKLVIDQHKKNNQDFTLSDLSQLENGTVEKVLATNLFRYVEHDNIGKILDLIYIKLTPNGTILIEDVDIITLSYQIFKRKIINPALSEILKHIVYATSLKEMTETLQAHNFKLTHKELINVRYYIEARKNH